MALYRLQLKHHGHKTGKAASAGEQAAYIVRDLQTPETRAYVEYVLRQSRSAKDREDCFYVEWHNLPAFAHHNPITFFQACDQDEGAKRRVSSSLEIALPRELPRDAQIALMQDYCASQFGRHAHLMGLHDSTGASGEPNPHFHVTWSARIHDGVERPAEEYFRRPPRGAGKDPLFREAAWLVATRQAWSDLVNVYQERHGIEHAYVDPRSLKAREIDRDPEPRLSPDHSTKVKLGKGVTPEWQALLDGRQARASSRASEQALAEAAWIVRKTELGITDVHTLDREAFVTQIAEQTRAYALHPPRRASLEHLRETVRELEGEVRDLGRQASLSHAEVMMATYRERQHSGHRRERGQSRERELTDAALDWLWEQPLIGNKKSMIYHLPVSHKNYDDINPANQEVFWTERAAQAAGYRRAANEHYGPGSGQRREARDANTQEAAGARDRAESTLGSRTPARSARRTQGAVEPPARRPRQPGARQGGGVLRDDEEHGGVLAPDLDKKRGRDGYDW